MRSLQSDSFGEKGVCGVDLRFVFLREAIAGGADFEAPLMKRAFDPDTGPLRDKAALRGRRVARCELFTGAFGEIRNPKGHNDATITDAVVAAEELMAAGVLRRIVDSA
jgi:hypothetical protein